MTPGASSACWKEILAFEPQLVIVYTGHNEYLWRFAHEKIPSLGWRFRLRQRLARLRIYQLLTFALRPAIGVAGSIDATDVLKEIPKEESFSRPRTEEETRLVVERFRKNIAESLRAAHEAGVPVVICTVASRLQAEIVHSAPASPEESARIAPYRSALAASSSEGEREAIARTALDAAPGYAPFWQALGAALEQRGALSGARDAYVKARELESNPARGGQPINDAVREIGAREGATVVDVERLFLAMDDRGCFGEQLFVDHVHPDREGLDRIAVAVADSVRWDSLPR
ncbi:MAG: hypothetical protein U0166_01985 [Acidobacteriota bacterium]